MSPSLSIAVPSGVNRNSCSADTESKAPVCLLQPQSCGGLVVLTCDAVFLFCMCQLYHVVRRCAGDGASQEDQVRIGRLGRVQGMLTHV